MINSYKSGCLKVFGSRLFVFIFGSVLIEHEPVAGGETGRGAESDAYSILEKVSERSLLFTV